jgi:alpha-tubulin suppressor-like RCC1 family protein
MFRHTNVVAIAALTSACSLVVPGNGGLTPDLDRADARARDSGHDDDDSGPPCAEGRLRCDGECIDPTSDPEFCGGCDVACGAGWTCRESECFDPVIDIALGNNHTCAVRGSGSVWCWGRNETGQLGTADFVDSMVPRRVVSLEEVRGISAAGTSFGGFPGTTCVRRSSGEAWCWGSNRYAQLGDGTTEQRNEPVRVATLVGVTDIRTSFRASCALRAASPNVYCWGERLSEPGTLVTEPTNPFGLESVAVTALALSGGHACVIDTNERLWCWGTNSTGALGDGATASRELAVMLTSIDDVEEVVAGPGVTCARQGTGQVWCWGTGTRIGLGLETTEPVTEPLELPSVRDATRIFAGSSLADSPTCALRADRSLWCWGFDVIETVRTGSAVMDLEPERVPTDIEFTSVAVGAAHMCGIDVAGRAYCWGSNEHGQLGDGTQENRFEPRQIALP